MVITWIGYCLLVSALLGLAAYASERALGHYRKPVRWGWFAAIAGSMTAPVIAFVAPGLFPGNSAALGPPPVEFAAPADPASAPLLVGPLAGREAAAGLDAAAIGGILGWVWALLVVAMLIHLVRVYGRLRLEMRGWKPGDVLGAPVLIADDRGPAVVGIGRSVVVMPKWISALEDRLLRLVFLHEREHQRAGDHRLFAAGIAALVLMPWNLFLWWQVSRLRLAIEFDCDRRVLARGESTRDYADALIAVGSRVSAPLLTAAAFAERKPAVERRLRRMTEPLARRRVLRTLGASGVAMLAVVFVLGCPTPENSLNAPEPPTVTLTAPSEAVEREPPPAPEAELGTRAERPTFIPFDTNPVLQNAREVTATLEAAYPADLKTAGVGGRAELWLYLDASGVVRNQQIKTTSGADALDLAATEVVKTMRFEPAMNRGQPTDAWVSQVVTFQVLDDAEPSLRSEGPAAEDVEEGSEEEITVTGVWDSGEDSADFLDGVRLIIDGVRQSEGMTLSDVSTLDIDHVEISRGELAIERYGEWARGGVIEITTGGPGQRDAQSGGPARIRRAPDSAAGSAAAGGRASIIISGVVGPDGTREHVSSTDNPLIVVDGVIQSEDVTLEDVGPQSLDIENVEILKGEQALEEYGERAQGGVIRITTKAGARDGGTGNPGP
ncbi:TonB family protein [Candidatus Palauibacter sp.]|uniref:TonB family protein n=1 Tax=Candidatus Palauibacter sp. TaxID=3101350 RepID=UPI003B01A2C6